MVPYLDVIGRATILWTQSQKHGGGIRTPNLGMFPCDRGRICQLTYTVSFRAPIDSIPERSG